MHNRFVKVNMKVHPLTSILTPPTMVIHESVHPPLWLMMRVLVCDVDCVEVYSQPVAAPQCHERNLQPDKPVLLVTLQNEITLFMCYFSILFVKSVF